MRKLMVRSLGKEMSSGLPKVVGNCAAGRKGILQSRHRTLRCGNSILWDISAVMLHVAQNIPSLSIGDRRIFENFAVFAVIHKHIACPLVENTAKCEKLPELGTCDD